MKIRFAAPVGSLLREYTDPKEARRLRRANERMLSDKASRHPLPGDYCYGWSEDSEGRYIGGSASYLRASGEY